MDAIVLGAGFAGLSAATALAETGARVLVLEARPALGGRATAFTDSSTGERVDNGQHVLFGCYHETFRFLRRIGAESHVDVQRRLTIDVVDRAGRASRLRCPPLPSPLHLLGGVMSWEALEWRDRVAALGIWRAVARDVGRGVTPGSPSDHETVRRWLVRHRQTPRTIEMLWEPLAVAALNQAIDEAAARSFTQVLRRMFGPSPRDASLALPVRPLDEMYALPARAFIEQRGGGVRTSAWARIDFAREANPSRPGESVRPVAHVAVRDEQMTAPVIICAVPWHALSEVIPDRPPTLDAVAAAAAGTAASPIVTVNLWFDRLVTDRVLVGLPGRTMQWVFDKRTVFGGRASHLSLVSSGADAVVARGNQELIDLALADVAGALPGACPAALLRAVVVRERRATFSVAPGQPPRPPTRTGVPGLFLAGDWIDTGLPGTIEGAVLSGHMAAAAAAEYLRLKGDS